MGKWGRKWGQIYFLAIEFDISPNQQMNTDRKKPAVLRSMAVRI